MSPIIRFYVHVQDFNEELIRLKIVSMTFAQIKEPKATYM